MLPVRNILESDRNRLDVKGWGPTCCANSNHRAAVAAHVKVDAETGTTQRASSRNAEHVRKTGQ